VEKGNSGNAEAYAGTEEIAPQNEWGRRHEEVLPSGTEQGSMPHGYGKTSGERVRENGRKNILISGEATLRSVIEETKPSQKQKKVIITTAGDAKEPERVIGCEKASNLSGKKPELGGKSCY